MILTLENSGAQRRRIATVGSFDGVHRGHQCILRQLKVLASERGFSPVVITFSRHPRTLMSEATPMLTSLDMKLGLIAATGIEDIILLDFNRELCTLTAAEFMALIKERFGVEAMLLGFNNHFGSDRLSTVEEYRRAGKGVGVAMYGAEELEDLNVSSTAIRRALNSGDVAMAAEMLGRYYSLTGRVVHGRALGRTIGFPTANIEQSAADGEVCIVPKRGVYIADVELGDGGTYRAIMNIGHRPTVSADGDDTIEVHLLDYSGDLYGETVTVKFLRRLRDEVRFDTVASLRSRLELDAAEARRFTY